MADETEPDASTPETSAAEGDASEERAGPGAGRGPVSLPGWLAAALVVVLGLAIGGAGFAIGRATAPDDGAGFAPIVRQLPGPGGRDEPNLPGFPGGPHFPDFPGGRRFHEREGRDGDRDDHQYGSHQDSTTTTTTPHT